jgi:hypothetical protein
VVTDYRLLNGAIGTQSSSHVTDVEDSIAHVLFEIGRLSQEMFQVALREALLTAFVPLPADAAEECYRLLVNTVSENDLRSFTEELLSLRSRCKDLHPKT